MKIALFNTVSPFIRGGAEILVDDLYDELIKRGHTVTLFRVPFPNNYEIPLMNLILAVKLMDFSEYDRVIAFKFPAFYAVHSKKVLWFFHQFRQVYELFDKEYGLKSDDIGLSLKEIIKHNDTKEIGNAHIVYTNAHEVTNRLKKYNDLASVILPPPLKEWEKYNYKEYGNFIYYPSRITNLKRQHLAVEAMKYVKSDVKLVIDGVCSESDYLEKIYYIIKKYKLEDKIIMENRWVTDEEKIDKMSKCLGCLYIAYKEDSYGFVSMESFYSSKPVITFSDSGGTVELITNNKTGYFTDPTPQALAEAMDKLYTNRENTIKMGQAARKEIMDRNITWDETVRRLLL
ncbi:glycosyltransferase family 4 protein [Lachnospiraceae bacterium NSJ-143]|nr:glycosyltransferase family 4 protein [Lachnospiraceae bacterium NSJ-143]